MTNNKVNEANEQSNSISLEDIKRLKERVMEECRKDSFKRDVAVASIGFGLGVGVTTILWWSVS